MQNVNYWYNEQIRTIILHTVRLFSNFYISDGKNAKGEEMLRRVPCTFMTSDKTAASIIIKNSDTILQSCPKMVLTIETIKLNNNLSSGSPYYEYETEFIEKEFNEETGNYVYKPGNIYHISRFNPVPIGFSFKLYIITSMLTQKFQLLEQIRALFSPTLELQTSENPLDWTRLTAITLTNLSWSTKGHMNLDNTSLDTMDMTFEINTNLDLPAIVSHSQIIKNIITDINTEGTSDIWGWKSDDIIRLYHTPDETSIIVDNLNEVTLIPTDKYNNWYKLFKLYNINYNKNKNNVYLHCNMTYDINKNKEIYGSLKINENNPLKAIWNIEEGQLPEPNVPDVDMIINPLEFSPKNIVGERYLIVEDIPNNTKTWGNLYNKYNQEIKTIHKNCIIEFNGNNWQVSIDPEDEPAIYYIKDKSDYKFIYTYNEEYNAWVDVVCKKYREGMWRLSTINN